MEYKEKLILKWMAGDISAEELKSLEESVDLKSLAAALEAQQSMELETIPEEELWDNVTKSISDVPQSNVKSQSDTNSSNKFSSSLIWIIIGAIALALITFLFFPKNSSKKIETKPQQQEEILMVDNTTIRLAPASYLSWNTERWDQNRILDLNGQAYFDVTRKGAFLVQTDLGEISVKGTSFDIWEIDEFRLRVQCFSGVVEVKNVAGERVTLTAGQEVYLFEDDFSKVAILTNPQPDWFSGGLNYQNIPFSSIFQDLNRFYGLAVTSEHIDESIGFTGYLPMNDLDNALEIITAVSGWKNERPNQSSLVFKK